MFLLSAGPDEVSVTCFRDKLTRHYGWEGSIDSGEHRLSRLSHCGYNKGRNGILIEFNILERQQCFKELKSYFGHLKNHHLNFLSVGAIIQ